MDASKAQSSDKQGVATDKSTDQSAVGATDVEENGDKNESDDGTDLQDAEEVSNFMTI